MELNTEHLEKTEEGSSATTIEEVEESVVEQFDKKTWDVTEAALSIHATLTIKSIEQCIGLAIVGNSGSGKSTVLKFFDGLDEQFYRSDDTTPASFVSCDGSMSEEELEEVDLLPKIRHKTLLTSDMASWFSGDAGSIHKMMSTLVDVMDGNGYTRDTGTQGSRGYYGDHRFGFIGATTPLNNRAWKVMGHTGNRFVFHEMPVEEDTEKVLEKVFIGKEYSGKVEECREDVHQFLQQLWEETGGYASVNWSNTPDSDIQDSLGYLADVVAYSRAPINEHGRPVREGRERIVTTLHNIARGHAVLHGRREVKIDDLHVPTRVALSTMQKERRPIVRTLLNPKTGRVVDTNDLLEYASKPTLIKRMKLMDTLELAEYEKGNSNNPSTLMLNEEFVFPDELEFPEFG